MILKFFRKWPIYPLLFTVNAVLSFYFVYFYDTRLRELLTSLGLALIFIALVGTLIWVLLRDLHKTAIVLFLFSILFFIFQNVVYSFHQLTLKIQATGSDKFWPSNNGQLVMFFIVIVFTTVIFLLVRKIEIIKKSYSLVLNLLCVLLIIATLVKGISGIVAFNDVKKGFQDYWQEHLAGIAVTQPIPEDSPDIYYIILDGFTRSDILASLYGLDNSWFTDALKERGFFVGEDSDANYTQTRTSLASSLNMMYLDEPALVAGSDQSYFFPLYYMIRHSNVEQTLRTLGYQMESYRSEISFLDFDDWGDFYQPGLIPGSFTRTFISTTALSPILNPLLYRWHRETITFTLDSVAKTEKNEGPEFIFAHILCPHPPFVFSSDGTPEKIRRVYSTQDASHFMAEGSVEEYREGYREQITYLQQQIIEMVDEIHQDPDRKIIILQGDHGSGMQLDHESLANTNIRERAGILNAIYFPDQDYGLMYPGISPVNTFRLVFTQYLGIEMPLLPDKHYFSPYTELLDLTQVDDLLE